MKTYKYAIVTLMLLFVLLSQALAKKPNYLYIQSAKEASLIYDSGKDIYHLTLADPDPWVVYFSEAPKKVTGMLPLKMFMDGLKKNKESINIGVIGLAEEKKENKLSYTFTLVNSSYDVEGETVEYDLKILEKSQKALLHPPLEFNHVAIFVDACASCGGSGF